MRMKNLHIKNGINRRTDERIVVYFGSTEMCIDQVLCKNNTTEHEIKGTAVKGIRKGRRGIETCQNG